MTPPVWLIPGCSAALLALAVAAIPFAGRRSGDWLVYGGSLVIGLTAGAAAVAALVTDAPATTLSLPIGLPWIGAHFRVDPLSELFLAVVDLGGAATSLFALGYGRHETERARVLPFYPAFLAGMNLVVVSDDAFSFLVSWEFMSLASWALVLAHHRSAENVKAAFVYLLMASFGTLALLLAFGFLAGPAGGYAFDLMRSAHPTPGRSALVVGLVLLGAGSKAGLVPWHVWLPLAHPAAPSHVSALMSGVMTKVAIYAVIRVVFDILGPAVWQQGLVMLALGAVTAVLGILYALVQEDLKRVLAYSTIENVGLIFVSLGLSLAFKANGLYAAAALAMTAALFHVINHALFKSLLFFGAGAVLSATGERRMDRLGGLIRLMPRTALAVLIGCVAISALPPMNGFASEWLGLQAILLGPRMPQWASTLLVPTTGALVALAAALAATCFVRMFGMAFLGRARSEAAQTAREVDAWQLGAMSILAVACLAAGVLPGFVIDALAPVVKAVAGVRMPVQANTAWLSIIPIAESRSSYNGLLVFVFITLSASIIALIVRGFAAHGVRRGPAWDCGFPDASPATQYTPSSFAQPVRRVFATRLFGVREQVDMPASGDPRPAHLIVTLHDPIWEGIYAPIVQATERAAGWLNRLQFLTIRMYLSLVFFALVALLLVLALWL